MRVRLRDASRVRGLTICPSILRDGPLALLRMRGWRAEKRKPMAPRSSPSREATVSVWNRPYGRQPAPGRTSSWVRAEPRRRPSDLVASQAPRGTAPRPANARLARAPLKRTRWTQDKGGLGGGDKLESRLLLCAMCRRGITNAMSVLLGLRRHAGQNRLTLSLAVECLLRAVTRRSQN